MPLLADAHGQAGQQLAAVHHVDGVAIGIGEAHALAAAGGVDLLDGGSALDLLFRRTLGPYGLVATPPGLLSTGTVTLAVEAFDRYGGLSDTTALQVSVSTV